MKNGELNDFIIDIANRDGQLAIERHRQEIGETSIIEVPGFTNNSRPTSKVIAMKGNNHAAFLLIMVAVILLMDASPSSASQEAAKLT